MTNTSGPVVHSAPDVALVSELRGMLGQLEQLDPDAVRWRSDAELGSLKHVVAQAAVQAERLLLHSCQFSERTRRVDAIRRALPNERLRQVLAMAAQGSNGDEAA